VINETLPPMLVPDGIDVPIMMCLGIFVSDCIELTPLMKELKARSEVRRNYRQKIEGEEKARIEQEELIRKQLEVRKNTQKSKQAVA